MPPGTENVASKTCIRSFFQIKFREACGASAPRLPSSNSNYMDQSLLETLLDGALGKIMIGCTQCREYSLRKPKRGMGIASRPLVVNIGMIGTPHSLAMAAKPVRLFHMSLWKRVAALEIHNSIQSRFVCCSLNSLLVVFREHRIEICTWSNRADLSLLQSLPALVFATGEANGLREERNK